MGVGTGVGSLDFVIGGSFEGCPLTPPLFSFPLFLAVYNVGLILTEALSYSFWTSFKSNSAVALTSE